MSIIQHSSQRIAVFVDVANLYHSAKHLFASRVNFKALLDNAVAKRQLIRSVAYVVRSGERDEQAFFDALTKASFEVKMKDLQIFAGGTKKGDWDVGLTVDVIRVAPSVDAVVLATGDGDFVPLVEYLKLRFGTQVELMAFGRSSSQLLKETVDAFTDLAEPKFLIPMSSERRRSNRGSRKSAS